LRQPHDLAEFTTDFLPSVERMVRRDGVHLFKIRYWDDVLSVWAGRLQRPTRVSYDPRDLSKIFVRGPDGAHWPVRFADLRRPPMTLSEHRRAQAALRNRGLTLVDEQLIFETIESQRAIVDEAVRRTRDARRLAERRDRALAGAAAPGSPRGCEATAAEPDDPPIDFSKCPIYPVEEWS
jgi:putative transposase